MISIIAAMDENYLIGANNALPWGKLPTDLKHFKELTIDKPIIMGRKTCESLGKPLPGRHNIVLTNDKNFKAIGFTIVHSVPEAIKASSEAEETMIIGGANIYAQFIPHAERLYLTFIGAKFKGDTYFPIKDFSNWKEIEKEIREPDETNELKLIFSVFEPLKTR